MRENIRKSCMMTNNIYSIYNVYNVCTNAVYYSLLLFIFSFSRNCSTLSFANVRRQQILQDGGVCLA